MTKFYYNNTTQENYGMDYNKARERAKAGDDVVRIFYDGKLDCYDEERI